MTTRKMIAEDIGVPPGPAPGPCAACGGYERLQDDWGSGGLNDVCSPCFYIWYDDAPCCERPEHRDQRPHIHSEDIGVRSRLLKAEGKYPWDRP